MTPEQIKGLLEAVQRAEEKTAEKMTAKKQKEKNKVERKIGKYHWLWAFILLASGLVAQEVQLTARSSRTSVGLDEPFRVTFSSNARVVISIPRILSTLLWSAVLTAHSRPKS